MIKPYCLDLFYGGTLLLAMYHGNFLFFERAQC